MPEGPPYLPTSQGLGGQPVPSVDDPVAGVLLLFFVAAAATNMAIFQINRRREHKFLFSVLLFGFCMARIAALVMRVAWASRPHDANIAIAAQVFTVAGVVILFVVNLVFASRLVRAFQPRLGWHRAVRAAFRFLYAGVGACLVMAIAANVQLFFTLDAGTRGRDRTVSLVASTCLAALAFAPIPIVLAAALLPREKDEDGRGRRPEKFGKGRLRTKVALLLATATLLSFGAGFRTGVAYRVVPLTVPTPWYLHKAAFYCVNFVVELIVVYAYTISRFDRRFHVPDGASAPGHYAAGREAAAEKAPKRVSTFSEHVNAEHDVFGPSDTDEWVRKDAEAQHQPGEPRAMSPEATARKPAVLPLLFHNQAGKSIDIDPSASKNLN